MKTKNTWLVIIGFAFITGSAMATLVVNRPHIDAVCKDVRVAMDGAIDASVAYSGLNHEYTVTLFRHRTNGHMRKETLGTFGPTFHTTNVQKDRYSASDLDLIISKMRDSHTGRYPASLEAKIDGKKETVNLGCIL